MGPEGTRLEHRTMRQPLPGPPSSARMRNTRGPAAAGPTPAASLGIRSSLNLDRAESTGARMTPTEIQDAVFEGMQEQVKNIAMCTPTDGAVRIRVAFTILRDGTVSDVAAVPVSGDHDAVVACVLKGVEAWTFPPLPRNQPVQRTFTFRAE